MPTWNYAVVHAHGTPRAIEDPARLLQILAELTDTHEAAQAVPWQVSDAPPGYIEGLLTAIVGIEIPITRLTGKWKVSQNRTMPDKLGVMAGLLSMGDEQSAAMADEVAERGGIGALRAFPN